MQGKFKTFRIVLMLVLSLIVGTVSAQTVTGNVVDETGEAVIGATVLEKGTKNATVTDFDGNFTIKLESGNVLTISYIGMQPQDVNVAGKTSVNVVLKEDATTLQDVVVIGYGTIKKQDLTGSVSSVNTEQLNAKGAPSVLGNLQGSNPGVSITQTSGRGGSYNIEIRGRSSINSGTTPLYVVDGVMCDDIDWLNPQDIERIDILKDASSTAIYGSRGANGVILVTTKSGQAGKTKVSYNAFYSIKNIAKKVDVLDPYEYAKWQYEYAMLYNNGDATKIGHYTSKFGNWEDMDVYQNFAGNDWQDIAFGRTGHTFNQNLNISGGSESIQYTFSYAHINDKAIMYGSNFKRDNFSLKLKTKPTKRTTLDFQARYSDTDIRGGGSNEASGAYDTDRRLKYAVLYSPIPLTGVGIVDEADQSSFVDPITATLDNDRKRERRNLNMSAAFGWEIFKNFKAKTEWGLDTYDEYDQRFWGLSAYYINNVPAAANQGHPGTRNVDTKRHRFRNTNTVSYDFKKIINNDDHSLNVLLGHEYVITKKHAITNEVHGFPTDYDAETAWKLPTQGTPYTIEDYYSADDKLLSLFGRLNYNYQDKYLVSATFRADASSKFAKENRWGYFPSAAIAWRISSEPFMESTRSWLDDLKLRFSYGTSGNNNIPTGQIVQMYENKTTSWVNGFPTYWAPSKTMYNSDLKWETTITRNVGLDFTVLGGKLNGSLEGYINTTKDLLIAFPTSGTGYDNQYRNLGKTQNSGVEFSFTYHAVNKKDWGIDINGNIGYNHNEIKELGINDFTTNTNWGSTEIGNDYRVAVGGSVGEIIGYQLDGRYEASDFASYNAATGTYTLKEGVVDGSAVIGSLRPGSIKLKDTTDDGKVTADDITTIGNVNPDLTGGFGINARAYGFDFAANFNFSIGNQVYNANKIEFTSATRTKYAQYRNLSTDMGSGKRWTYIDDNGQFVTDLAQLAAMNANTTMWSPYMNNFILTDWAVEDASFLRLNTLTLGYTLPKAITMRAGITSLRFYVTAYNVFTITGYSGSDPESDCIRKSNLTPGVDYSGYPRSRQFVFGLNLNF